MSSYTGDAIIAIDAMWDVATYIANSLVSAIDPAHKTVTPAGFLPDQPVMDALAQFDALQGTPDASAIGQLADTFGVVADLVDCADAWTLSCVLCALATFVSCSGDAAQFTDHARGGKS